MGAIRGPKHTPSMTSQVLRPHEAPWAHQSPKYLLRYAPSEALENVLASSPSKAISQFILKLKTKLNHSKSATVFYYGE